MRTALFGHVYDAPFGVAPVGLQGLIWPGAPEILCRGLHFDHNIPFILRHSLPSSIRNDRGNNGRAWFQLYHPAEPEIRDSVIKRAAAANYPVLVLLCDVPALVSGQETSATFWPHAAAHDR